MRLERATTDVIDVDRRLAVTAALDVPVRRLLITAVEYVALILYRPEGDVGPLRRQDARIWVQ